MTYEQDYEQKYRALEVAAQTGRMSWEGAMARVALLSIDYGKRVAESEAQTAKEDAK